MWHMTFCSVAAAALVRLGYVPATEGVTREVLLHQQPSHAEPCHMRGGNKVLSCQQSSASTRCAGVRTFAGCAAVACSQVYVKAILPIGALFSVTLWLGNTAVMYISVAFAQMLKVRCAGPAVQNFVNMQPHRLPHPPCLPASTPHSSRPCATPPYQPCDKTQGADCIISDPDSRP